MKVWYYMMPNIFTILSSECTIIIWKHILLAECHHFN